MESLKSFLSQTKEYYEERGENLDFKDANNDMKTIQLILIEVIIHQKMSSSISDRLLSLKKIVNDLVSRPRTVNKGEKGHSIIDFERFNIDLEIYDALFKQVELDFNNITIMLNIITKGHHRMSNALNAIEGLFRSCLVRLDIIDAFISKTTGLPLSNICQKIESIKKM